MLLFATEAIAGRDAIFFDSPTRDLDASSALQMVTALQRAARGGRLVAISMTSLTFREYAMLDNIQILSSNGTGKLDFQTTTTLYCCYLKWCIRQLCSSSIISHNITNIAHNHHTDIPLKTTVYFGSGASAVSYFSGLGRTPAPGASITDFLLDLVDDEMWPGGYADAHLTYLEKAAEAMSLRLLSQQENQQESRRKAGKLV